MSKHCQLTGKRPDFGKRVSHSHRRTSRRFDPNIQSKTYFVPTLGRKVHLHLSTKAIKTIDKIGIDTAIAQMRLRAEKF